MRHRKIEPAIVGAALRRYLDSMGFTYIKMGQFLALRFDVLPPEICDELRKLFDSADPVAFSEVKERIESELGGPLDRFFVSVEAQPVAAASLAQVHLAVASDGERLALKVQRTSARRDFESDMALARFGARVVDRLHVLGSLKLIEMLGEFERFTERELDFETEGRVATRLRENSGPGVRVPRIRWDLTTPRVLAMEYIDGRALTEAMELTKQGRQTEYDERFPGVDIGDVVRRVADESLRQILVDGLFHADPHPGNILIDENGVVVYLDFGMFGSLTPGQRANCFGYIENAAAGRPAQSFDHFYRLVIPTPDLNRVLFRQRMIELMRDWGEWTADDRSEISDRHLGAIITKTLTTMRSTGARFDTDLLLFWRVLFVLDSVALDLAEHVDLMAVMRAFFVRESSPIQTQLDQLMNSGALDIGAQRRTLARASARWATASVGHERVPVELLGLRRTRRDEQYRVALIATSCATVVAAILTRL